VGGRCEDCPIDDGTHGAGVVEGVRAHATTPKEAAMCGRYSTGQLSLPRLAEQFQADPAEVEATGDRMSWNVTPTSQVLVITSTSQAPPGHSDAQPDAQDHTDDDSADTGGAGHSGSTRQLRRLRWGLVPSWAKDAKAGNRMINVRAESVTDKPTFKRLLASKRCILPADGFYEWQDLGDDPDAPDAGPTGRPKQRGRKQPFYITTRDGAPLALAGLWTTNSHADPAGPLETCTILTTSANQLMATIHHRMPVILPPDAWDTWLDPDLDDLEVLAGLLVPAPDDLLTLWPIDPAVNSPRSNGEELTRPLEGHEPRTWS
jgi:putative SOS response-associated peptidase YedK